MKTSILLILSLVVFVCLGAQTQLPDLEIRGDVSIRLPLSKRPFLVGEYKGAIDSLSAFLPLLHGAPSTVVTTHRAHQRRVTIDMNVAPTLATNVFVSAYNFHDNLEHIRADVRMNRVKARWFEQSWGLYGVNSLLNGFPIQHSIRYQYARTPSYYSESFAFINRIVLPDFKVANLSINGLDTRIVYQSLDQKVEATSIDDTHIDITHKHRISLDEHAVDNEMDIVSGGTGLASTYSLVIPWIGGIDTRLGLMTNMLHLNPVIDISKTFWIKPDLYVRILNSPVIIPHERSELMTNFLWAAQPQKGYMGMRPVSLSASVGKTLFGSNHAVMPVSTKPRQRKNEVYLAHKLIYEYHKPVLTAGAFAAVPSVLFADVLENTTSIGAKVNFNNISISQDLSVHMGHLAEYSFTPIPYVPILQAKTALSTKIHDVKTMISLEQGYWGKDHNRNSLPAVFDLSARAEYDLNRAVKIYAILGNVIHTPKRQWASLPGNGRNIRFGFQYVVR